MLLEAYLWGLTGLADIDISKPRILDVTRIELNHIYLPNPRITIDRITLTREIVH
jgi:hypothetical protein